MVVNETPIRIQEDLYSRQEQFVDLAPDVQIGNQGTVRIQNFSFLDGEAIYLNVGAIEVRRDAGFQTSLILKKSDQDSRSYCCRAGQWYQQTNSPEPTLTSLQRRVGQYGFWFGLHEWAVDVGEVIANVIWYCLSPFLIVPVLVLRSGEFLWSVFCVAAICFFFWKTVLEVLVGLLFGPGVLRPWGFA